MLASTLVLAPVRSKEPRERRAAPAAARDGRRRRHEPDFGYLAKFAQFATGLSQPEPPGSSLGYPPPANVRHALSATPHARSTRSRHTPHARPTARATPHLMPQVARRSSSGPYHVHKRLTITRVRQAPAPAAHAAASPCCAASGSHHGLRRPWVELGLGDGHGS